MTARIASLRTVPFDTLTDADLDAWHRLRASNPALDSPYFHPGFAAAVNKGRPVQVVVGRDEHGEIAGLLAVHREGALLRPVGWPGADFQSPIAAPGTTFPAAKLLTGGVKRFAFDHLLEPNPDFAPWFESSRPSPFVDTTGGLEGYLARASKSGKDNMGQARRRTNKAEKQLGPIRFGADVVDEDALREVVRLKRGQYEATGAVDYFAEPDRVDMLTRLLHTRGTDFAGILSTVHAGPHLLAAHFGIRSGSVLHWWFPVYDPEFSALAPGWILLRELVQAAPELGVGRIDFGRGDDEYKRRAKTGEVQVAQGVVTRSSAYRVVRRARNSLISAAKQSALAPQLRTIAHRLRAHNR